MAQRIQDIAILGGGPAGATLATLLARKGYRVAIFHTPKRPALIVGESLLPAVIPMVRELGIEEQVKSFSVRKPGATVCLGMDDIITAYFHWADGKLPDYAYNTQRDLFDEAVLTAARQAGATLFRTPARVEAGPTPGSVQLASQTLAATDAFFSGQPDLIIDATGRARLLSKFLKGEVDLGGRNDVALFAHLDKAVITDPGHIHVDYLTRGWSWRIPLPGKVSFGFVIQPHHLEGMGDTLEEQYETYIRQEPSLRFYAQGARRLTPVVKYHNYQVISRQMHGPGWAMVGDAAGFIDPVFSTGLYLGMKGAFEMFKAIEAGMTPAVMNRYQKGRHWELRMWQGVIRSWYNGKLFNLYRAGRRHTNSFLGQRIEHRFRRRIVRVFTGQAVDELARMRLFDYLTHFGTLLRDPSDLVVR